MTKKESEKSQTNSTESNAKSAEEMKAEALRSIAMNKNTSSTPVNKKTAKHHSETVTVKSSPKTAWLALIIAILASGSVAGLYYWQQQQQAQISQQLRKQIAENRQQILTQSQQQLSHALTQQQQNIDKQFQQFVSEFNQQQQNQLTELKQQIQQVSEHKPSDWLVNEAYYLIRVALRSLWLEKDARSAIALLTDADQQIAALNSPQYLPLRSAIHQDIEQLQLLPKLTTDETLLSLIGLNQQVVHLPLHKPTFIDADKQNKFQLSEDTSQWKANLAKVWQKFLDNFITIRRRDAETEPLLAPEYQQHLRENLSLKLQLAQWAVSQGNTQLYRKSLTDIAQWHQRYFALDEVANQQFLKRINELKQAVIAVDFPKNLRSLMAIEKIQASSNSSLKTVTKKAVTEKITDKVTEKKASTKAKAAKLTKDKKSVGEAVKKQAEKNTIKTPVNEGAL